MSYNSNMKIFSLKIQKHFVKNDQQETIRGKEKKPNESKKGDAGTCMAYIEQL